MSRQRSILAVLALMLSALPMGLSAQPQQSPTTLDDTGRREAVAAAAGILRNRYIFPDIGEQAAQAIESALAGGSYDDLDQRAAFAARLTEDLQAVAHDKHLRVSAPGAPSAPAGGAPPPVRPRAEGGVTRADIIGNDVGYLEIIGFPPPFQFNGPADRALAALRDTRALIIDIRRNGGGSPDSVSRLVSYFLDGGEPVHINTFINRTPDTTTFTTREFWSETTPFSYLAKPVYVLTSGFTFSGGEEFAYDMQVMDLAVIVGDTTGGGANPGGTMPLATGLGMFVPGGRAENPITGTNWEGVGVIPDISVPSADALRAALEELGVSPALADIDAASGTRVFEPAPPRTEPQPGVEATIRRISGELARGEPNYELLTPQMAEVTRTQLPVLTERLSSLGAVESVTFVEVAPNGSDVYDVAYENGGLRWMVALDAEGRAAGVGFQPLPDQP
jgi:hypothetical protein